MSDHLSIAAVTKTLCDSLGDALTSRLPSEQVKVSSARPSQDDKAEASVFVFLYRVSPNVAQRNADLPARSSSGRLGQRSRLAVDLHYLLAFRGDESTFVPEKMLGVVASQLHAQPTLTRGALKRSLGQAKSPLDGCDLGAEPELVRFTPADLSLEELSKVWSALAPAPQLLSIGYRASVLYIDAPLLPEPAASPVKRVVIAARPEPTP